MGQLVAFRSSADTKAGGFVSFGRAELSQLLSLYSEKVAKGVWKDYAIDLGAEAACFHVFKHAHDKPQFSVVKVAKAPNNKGRYILLDHLGEVTRKRTLKDALQALMKAAKQPQRGRGRR